MGEDERKRKKEKKTKKNIPIPRAPQFPLFYIYRYFHTCFVGKFTIFHQHMKFGKTFTSPLRASYTCAEKRSFYTWGGAESDLKDGRARKQLAYET